MRLAVAAFLAVSFATAAPAQVEANLREMAETPLLSLNVRETIRSEPDRAVIRATVTTRAAKATDAMAENSTSMEKVLAAVRAAGIPSDRLQTARIRLDAQHVYDTVDGRRVRRFDGYQASNSIRIELRDVSKVAPLLDTLVAAGATEISGPSFSATVSDAVKREARAKALAAADQEAAEFARLRGYARARLDSIDERGTAAEVVVRGSSMAAPPPPPPPPPPIATGEVTTSTLLSLQYILVR